MASTKTATKKAPAKKAATTKAVVTKAGAKALVKSVAADMINQLHTMAVGVTMVAATDIVEAWAEVGEALSKQKKKTPHGQWIPWVEKYLKFDRRQAARYMEAFDKKDDIKALGTTNLNKALAQIAPPKDDDDLDVTVDSVDEEIIEKDEQITKLEKELAEAKELIEDLENEDDSEYEQMYTDTLAELEKLKKQGKESKGDVEDAVDKLKKAREKLRSDVSGLKDLAAMLKRSRDFFAKEVALVPTLHVSPTIVKNTKKDVASLLGMMENWVTAMKEKFDV